jgi:hypothetical protein
MRKPKCDSGLRRNDEVERFEVERFEVERFDVERFDVERFVGWRTPWASATARH